MDKSLARHLDQGSFILLLPLLCLALISSGLDPRLPQQFTEEFRQTIVNFSEIFFPGAFAAAAAFLMPSYWRSMQILSVSVIYSAITVIDPHGLQDLCSSPIVPVMSSLSATFLYLPTERKTELEQDLGQGIIRFIQAALLATTVYILLLSIVDSLADFIDLTFSRAFHISLLTAVITPVYSIMQTVGYTELVSTIRPLQTDDPHMLAVTTAVIGTNLISFPAILMARSVIAKPSRRLFLISLGLITIITSHIGICISIELTLLLLFFPGTYVLLLTSSALLCLCCFFLQNCCLSGVVQLYQPNLILPVTDVFALHDNDLACLLLAFFIPIILLMVMSYAKKRYGRALGSTTDTHSLRYYLDKKSSPDLVALALLRAFGGLSNIVAVNHQGRELLVEVVDLNTVSADAIHKICHRRCRIDRRSKIYFCHTGANSTVIMQRIKHLLTGTKIREEIVSSYTSPMFNIREFVKLRDEKKGNTPND